MVSWLGRMLRYGFRAWKAAQLWFPGLEGCIGMASHSYGFHVGSNLLEVGSKCSMLPQVSPGMPQVGPGMPQVGPKLTQFGSKAVPCESE